MNDCPGCGMKIDTFNHADNCAFKKPEHLAELDGERQMTAPTIAEQIAFLGQEQMKATYIKDVNPDYVAMFHTIRASLEKLQSIESQPVPVGPECIGEWRHAMQFPKAYDHVHIDHREVVTYIDSLQSELQRAQQELLDTTWQDHADHWKKRAEQAEKDRDICYISLQDMRRRLHEIASLVTDPRLDEKHTA